MTVIRNAINAVHAVTVFIGKVLCDYPTLESRAFGEGFDYGRQTVYDQFAYLTHTTPERDCDG